MLCGGIDRQLLHVEAESQDKVYQNYKESWEQIQDKNLGLLTFLHKRGVRIVTWAWE